MNMKVGLSILQKSREIESILMHFNQAITSFTSREYLIKSYFQILLILVFEKKDYYGAQYEVNRLRKILPFKGESAKIKDEDEGDISRVSKMFSEDEGGEKEEPFNRSFG